ncbi:MAG: hypothetical protein AB1545_16260 [Thermodesulfobacteriota bacterium]
MLRETALNEVEVPLSEVNVMSVSSQYACWEIMQCGNQICPARVQRNIPCWEIASKLNDYRSALNVCSDCIVYLRHHKNSILSNKEIDEILKQKGVCMLRDKCQQKAD